MLGVDHVKDTGAVPKEAADVVQRTMPLSLPETRAMTMGTTAATVGPRSSLDEWRREILDTSNPLCAVWNILARFHDRLLLPENRP
jgi:hypothetical protein